MTWKKFFTKSWQLFELIASFSPSKEERQREAMRDVESMYDAAYYSGKMSYGVAEAYKDSFRYSIGLDKKY